jgi:hypothetical protein
MEGLAQPFRFSPVGTDRPQALGSHTVTPEAALHLARILFGAAPEAWILAVAGYAFEEVREGLSAQAGANLAAATGFLAGWIAGETAKRHTPGTPQFG